MTPLGTRPPLSFVHRLAASALVAMVAFLTVGALGVVTVQRLSTATDSLSDAQQALRSQLLADMMHDALRADALAAAQATTPTARAAAATDAGRHAALAQTELRSLHSVLESAHADSSLRVLSDKTTGEFLDYIATVEAFIADASRPGGSSTQLDGVVSAFEALEGRQADVTRYLDDWARATEAHAQAAGSQGLIGMAFAIGVSFALMVVLQLWCRRGMEQTLDEQRATHAQLERTNSEVGALSDRMRVAMEHQQFVNQVNDAFDMAQRESDIYQTAGRALVTLGDDPTSELLVADNSRAHLTAAVSIGLAEGAGCSVDSPWDCVAARRGSTMTFGSSNELNACPKLRDRVGGAVSAVCVPVTFMGQPLGVLHTTGPDGQPPDETATARLGVIAAETGDRLGTMRALAKTQLQASTDVLTGLANRRMLEEHVRTMMDRHQPLAVALGDLDHFKLINDTFGHDAGDRALRTFARVLQTSVRPGDFVARYGGEEFVVVLPDSTAAGASNVLARVQEALARALSQGDHPTFTVSFGVTASDGHGELVSLLSTADRALLKAKKAGRNRVVIASDNDAESEADEQPAGPESIHDIAITGV